MFDGQTWERVQCFQDLSWEAKGWCLCSILGLFFCVSSRSQGFWVTYGQMTICLPDWDKGEGFITWETLENSFKCVKSSTNIDWYVHQCYVPKTLYGCPVFLCHMPMSCNTEAHASFMPPSLCMPLLTIKAPLCHLIPAAMKIKSSTVKVPNLQPV